ncbi:RNA-binding protein squid [Bicyclus anynana]|uniref:RNA-binding protein squid n=1 Tax=Bicyclus anynana TaxID=110368 RepID=A0A6J1MY05_BICAN|nr:RNA-binding protein squid [Bicyclus anynana]
MDRRHLGVDNMASYQIFLLTVIYVLTIALCAPSEKIDKDDLIVADKEDLQTAASHWGGGWGGYGLYGGYGGYYPHYGYYGYPTYGYGYGYGGWPYGGYYGHHGYWW